MGRKESTVRLFTRDGVPIRVCSRLATAVDTSGEATKGFDPIYRVGRKIDMYKVDFKEALCLFKGKEARLPVIQVIETKNVGVSSSGNLASFLRLAAEADALKNRVSNEKARHHTSALLRNFKLDDKGPLDKLEVFKFVRSWVRAFVPPNLLGSKNTKFFLDNLKFVLGAGKGSSVRLWQVMRRMSVDTVLWLNSSEVAAERVPLVLKQQALAKVVVWLLQNVVWRVITSYFHLTDMSGTRHKLQFYRKKHFHALFNLNLRDFVSDDLLKPLSTNKAMDVLSIPDCPGEAKGRLFPKASGGCRLLAAKKNAHANEDDSRLLLALLKDRHPEVVDSRGRGLHRGWSKFAKKAKEKGAKIFFVRVDIKNAFDTIKLSKLSEILVNLAKNEMRETAYVHTVRYLDQHGRVFRSRRLSSKRKREYPVPDGCRLLPVASRPIEARRLLKWVERRGRLHTIAISVGRSRGPLRFLKQKGLIQGDTLSSALCDLYYGEMVKSQLEPAMRREVGAGERRLFVRGVDDFAFFSTSRREAERFLRLMEKGFPEYDCFIRPEKTVTNLGGSGASEFSFCGTLIDAENLQTRPDFSSYHGRSVVDSLKFNLRKGTTEESLLQQKMLFVCTQRIDPLYLDGNFNSPTRVRENLFETFRMAALRFDSMMDSVIFPRKEKASLEFLSVLLEECLLKILRRLRSLQLTSPSCHVPRAEAGFLFYTAFLQVSLKRKCQHGSAFVTWLKRKCVANRSSASNNTEVDLSQVCKRVANEQVGKIRSHGYQKLK